jgi:hypothetical protein
MANQFAVNVDCAANGGATAVWRLVQLLTANGWAQVGSGDGTTFAVGSAGPVASGAAGVGGLDNVGAWVIVREPSSGRSYAFQRGTANDAAWWVRYSRTAAISTGGSATVMPTSAEIQNIFGTSATGTTIFDTTGGTGTRNYYAHCGMDDAPRNGAYAFYLLTTLKGTGTLRGGIAAYPMDLMSTGDQDPLVIGAGATSAATNANANKFGWFKYGLVGESWQISISLFNSMGGLSGPNAYSGEDDTFPAYFAHSVSWKGGSTWVRCPAYARSYPDTLDLVTDAYVYTATSGSLVFPWPASVTPML